MASKDNSLIKSIIKRFNEVNGPKARRHTNASRDWFRKTLRKNFNNVRYPRLLEKAKIVSKPQVGAMYSFIYDAKTKDTLPVWDAAPLIFMIAPHEDGKSFYGLNLHYIQPALRVKVFVELLKLKSSSAYRPSTKLRLNYGLLKSMSNSKYLMHAFKRYNFANMRSKFVKIEPEVWEIVLTLPTANWQKGGASSAWKV